MGKVLDEIDTELAVWLEAQPVFFVASAPLSAQGHINCSPKGGDSFRVLGPLEAAYLDFTGSGVETISHLQENGRIVLSARFPPNPGARAVVRVRVERLSTSCGFAVPLMDYRADRDVLDKWAHSKGAEGLAEYRALKNARSIDGLPGLRK